MNNYQNAKEEIISIKRNNLESQTPSEEFQVRIIDKLLINKKTILDLRIKSHKHHK